jgi:hypothetical protein
VFDSSSGVTKSADRISPSRPLRFLEPTPAFTTPAFIIRQADDRLGRKRNQSSADATSAYASGSDGWVRFGVASGALARGR